jgi:hypothetical protein
MVLLQIHKPILYKLTLAIKESAKVQFLYSPLVSFNFTCRSIWICPEQRIILTLYQKWAENLSQAI